MRKGFSALVRSLGLAAALLLAGCTIESTQALIDQDALTHPLPEEIWLHSYTLMETGEYLPNNGEPERYGRNGAYYHGTAITSRPAGFLELSPDFYLLVLIDPTEVIYGFARLHGQVLLLEVALAENTDSLLDKFEALVSPEVDAALGRAQMLQNDAALHVEDGNTLGELVRLYMEGHLPYRRSIYYWTRTPDEPLPPSLPAALADTPPTLASAVPAMAGLEPAPLPTIPWQLNDRRNADGTGNIVAFLRAQRVEGAGGDATIMLGCDSADPRGLTMLVQFPQPPALVDWSGISIVEAEVILDGALPRKLALELVPGQTQLGIGLTETRGRFVEFSTENFFDLNAPRPPTHWPPAEFADQLAAAVDLVVSTDGPAGRMTAHFSLPPGIDKLDTVRNTCPA